MKYLALLVALVVASPAWASPTADLVARYSYRTGTTLTAPAAVFFDATGTTDSNTDVRPFHDLRYFIDYDDADCSSGQGNWARGANSMSRNSDQSAIGGHVYECAGSYTIVLTVTDSTGATSTDSVSFTVESEDTGWTDANTVCVSTSGTFTGCPIDDDLDGDCSEAPSSCVTSPDFDANFQTAAGKRTLYRCGETFVWGATDLDVTAADTNGSLVGGFGSCSGNPALVTYTGPTSRVRDSTGGDTFEGWRLRDISFAVSSGDGGTQLFGVSTGANTVTDVLFLRTTFTGVGICPAFTLLNTTAANNERIAYVDNVCEYTYNNVSTQFRILFHTARYAFYYGNDWSGDADGDGGMRLMGTEYTHMAHNTVSASSNAQLTLQFRGPDESAGRPDRYLVFDDNRLVDNATGETQRMVRVAWNHGGDGSEPGLDKRDHIFERNLISYLSAHTVSVGSVFIIAGHDMTVRNNIIDYRAPTRSTFQATAVSMEPSANSNDASEPTNVHVYNNTIVRDEDSTAQTYIFQTSGYGSGQIARNNLIYDAVDSDTSLTSGTPDAESNNVHMDGDAGGDNCPFHGTDGSCTLTGACAPSDTISASCFKIRASGGGRATVVDAGFDFPETATGFEDYVFTDAFLGCRGSATGGPDAEWDIGAHEYGSTTCAQSALTTILRGGIFRGGTLR